MKISIDTFRDDISFLQRSKIDFTISKNKYRNYSGIPNSNFDVDVIVTINDHEIINANDILILAETIKKYKELNQKR